MAVLGVLLGISVAVLGWLLREQHHDRQLIITLQNNLAFTAGRVTALEKRKPLESESAAPATRPAIRRQWSEDMPEREA